MFSKIIKQSYVAMGEEYLLQTYSRPTTILDGTEQSQLPDVQENIEVDEKKLRMEQVEKQIAELKLQADREIARQWEEIETAKEAALIQAMEEGKNLGLQQGYVEGYQQGLQEGQKQGLEEFEEKQEQIIDLLQQIEQTYQGAIAQSVDDLKYLAVEISSKIIHQYIELDHSVYVELIAQALSRFRDFQWVEIYITEDQQLKTYLDVNLLKRFQINQNFRIHENKDLPVGSCLVETDEGVIDASIPVQLENVKQILAENE